MFDSTGLDKMVYTPSLWAINGHAQGIWFLIVEYFENLWSTIKYDRTIFKLKDGGQIAIDWLRYPDPDKVRDIVVVVPGLGGDHRELYSLATAKECRQNGLACVVVNYRGNSGVPLLVSTK